MRFVNHQNRNRSLAMVQKTSLAATIALSMLVVATIASANDGFYPVPQVTYYYPDTAYDPQTNYYGGAPTATYYGVTPTTTFAEPTSQPAATSPGPQQQPTPADRGSQPASGSSASPAPAPTATSQ